MRSKVDANIFVVGDACIPGDMPKSAFSANSQAKVAAMTIRADLTRSRAFPARYANTCWSLIAPDDGVKSRRHLRARRRQDQADLGFREPARRELPTLRRAELRGIGRLVRRHHRRDVRLTGRYAAPMRPGSSRSSVSPEDHGMSKCLQAILVLLAGWCRRARLSGGGNGADRRLVASRRDEIHVSARAAAADHQSAAGRSGPRAVLRSGAVRIRGRPPASPAICRNSAGRSRKRRARTIPAS